jgi:hypothetical protein
MILDGILERYYETIPGDIGTKYASEIWRNFGAESWGEILERNYETKFWDRIQGRNFWSGTI